MNEPRTGSEHRVAIIHFRGDFDTVPALRSSVTLLLRHGHAVDVIYVSDPAFLPPSLEPAALLVPLPRLPRRGLPTSIRRMLEAGMWLFLTFRYCMRRSYTCLIGVDPVGLIVSGLLARIFRMTLVYFSLEIYPSSEIATLHIRLLKVLERFFNRRSVLTVVQDQDRARLLANENHIPLETMALLPNSPLGLPTPVRDPYLRHTLKIPSGQRVVLYAGALAHWTYTPELIECARHWPADWTLVLHNRQVGNELGLDLAAFPWVRHSGGPVPYEDLPRLISSADVGLVLYRNADTVWQGNNMTHVGLSSGKLAQYLRVGVPVGVVAFPGLCAIVERYHCGICVEDVSTLQNAITNILDNYSYYVQGAIDCYTDLFAFEPRFEAFLKRLVATTAHPPAQESA